MKRLFTSLLVLGTLASTLCSCNGSSNEVADLVVKGTIYTAEKENNGEATAFAVKDGKYIYVGDEQGVNKYIKEGKTQVINNNDGLVIPGATEGHGHFIGVDAMMRQFPGYDVQYFVEPGQKGLKDILKETLQNNPNSKFFISWGLVFHKFTGDPNFDPNKSYAQEIQDIVDELNMDIPVIFFDNAGHQALCNNKVLKEAGLYDFDEKKIIAPPGGTVYLTQDKSAPNGWIGDELVFYTANKVLDFNSIDDKIFQNAVNGGLNELHARGFTNYLDAAVNALNAEKLYKNIKELDTNNNFGLNMASCYIIQKPNVNELHAKIDEAKALGDSYKTDHFNPHNIKLWIDGVTESRTGWVSKPYPNPISEDFKYGNKIWTKEEIKDIVTYSNKNNLQVHSHTFGDEAVSATIDAYIYSDGLYGRFNYNSLGHVRNIKHEDIDRCAINKISIAENLVWHNSGIPEGPDYETYYKMASDLMPEGFWETGYPMKSLLHAGINVTSSTDAPAAEAIKGNIQNIIEVATTGMDPNMDTRAFGISELLTVKEALECLTINGAKQLGIDDKCGSIKVGKNADFVVLDRNFLHYAELEDLRTIHNVNIESVYFEGKKVFPKNN